jgi:acetyltransferase-like isoleucine patch superfamily enzyme
VSGALSPLALGRALWLMVVTFLPGATGNELRRRYYRSRVRHMGEDVLIDVGVQLVGAEHMSFGDNCWIDKYVVLLAGPPRRGERRVARQPTDAFEREEGELVVGRNCHIAHHVVINAHGGVVIGDDTGVAAGSKLVSLSHHYRNVDDRDDDFLYRFGPRSPEREQALISSPIVLGANTAVATNCVLFPGATVGRDSWVGAGSTVSGEIPPGVIAVGTPAQPVKDRPFAERPARSA